MRVNIYAEEMTDRIEIISKEIDGQTFTGLRVYLELPATVNGQQYQGPFMHRPGDDDSSAVTFWGKRDLRGLLDKAIEALDKHYIDQARARAVAQAVRCTCPSGRESLMHVPTCPRSDESRRELAAEIARRVVAVGVPLAQAIGQALGASSTREDE